MECFKVRDRLTREWCKTSRTGIWETEYAAKMAVRFIMKDVSGSIEDDFDIVEFKMVEQEVPWP